MTVALASLILTLAACVFETRHHPPKILFLGNSITFSGRSEPFQWPHAHGMAASAESRDYVHQTVRILKEKGLELEPVLGSRDCQICDGVIGEHLERVSDVRRIRPRYVVVQLGENATEAEIQSGRLTREYRELLQGLKDNGARRIFCISNWDEDTLGTPRNEAILRAVRHFPGIRVVDISKVSQDPAAFGDSLLFPDVNVRWHPGDKGMEGIATLLASAILEHP